MTTQMSLYRIEAADGSSNDRVPSERRLSNAKQRGGAKISKPDSSSVRQAIRMAQQGERTAFELIYGLYCRRVYALCLRMVRDSIEAEDLTQEVFLELFRKIHTFRGKSAFSSWLYRVTTNLVLMHFRKDKRITTSLDEMGMTDEETGMPHRQFGAPDLRLTGLFDRSNLDAAINDLSEGQRAAVILYDVQGFSHSEVAEILGCSVDSSKSHLHRARKRLRKMLGSLRLHRTYNSKE